MRQRHEVIVTDNGEYRSCDERDVGRGECRSRGEHFEAFAHGHVQVLGTVGTVGRAFDVSLTQCRHKR